MKILIAWELGKNFGHIIKIIEMAKPLYDRGAEIIFAVQDPGEFLKFKPDYPYTMLQAPFASIRPIKSPILTFTDDLRPCGYNNSSTMAGLIEAWRSLYDLVSPDILVTQSSPTALIAARDLNFPKVAFGTSYELPPLQTPMPLIPYWENVSEDILLKREQDVLSNVNEALKGFSIKLYDHFSDIYEVDAKFVCGFEELDHYPDRQENVKYYGTLFKTNAGASLKWNSKASKHIFAYLRPKEKSFKPVFSALCELPNNYDVIIAAPGIDPKLKEAYENNHVGIEDGPVKLDNIMSKCDLAVCHAGVGISSAFLLKGVPLMLFPGHIEQLMFGRAIGRLGAGRGAFGHVTTDKVHELINLLLNEEEFKEAAKSFAKKYKGYKPSKAVEDMADEIFKLSKSKKPRKKKRA
ncbi:MAG: hypothetical protein AAF569_00070 [Pseudomonadota bacterium]